MPANKKGETLQSAAKAMATAIPRFSTDQKVSAARAEFLKKIKTYQLIDNVYFIDQQEKLAGVLSVQEFFSARGNSKLSTVMKRKPITVKADTDQERVGILALKNKIESVPVVDPEGKLLGAISPKKILTIVYREHQEDIMKICGIKQGISPISEVARTPVTVSFWHRIPWLLIGLAGGIAAAAIISGFETTLRENLILASFIPLLLYLADAVGTQMEAFIIRDSAIDPKFRFKKYFFRQLSIVILIGIFISLVLFSVNALWHADVAIAAVISLALFIAVISSVFTGLIIPFIMIKLRVDPADSSGPIATVIQDVISVVIYFLIAIAIL